MTMRALVGGLLLVMAGAGCTGGASQPVAGRSPSPAPTPASRSADAMTVTPAQHLRNRQRVEVALAGFPNGTKVWLSECAGAAEANPVGCGAQLASQPILVTDDRGAGSRRFMVRAVAATGALRSPSVPCRYTCVLVATTGDTPQPVVAVTALRFAVRASPRDLARLRVRPAGDLRDGQRVTLDVTGFLPGEKVWFSECAPAQQPTRAAGCGGQAATEPFTITDDAGTRRGMGFRVTAASHGVPCQPSCSIAAIGDHELAVARIRFR